MVDLQNIADRSALSLADVEKLEKSILETGYFSPEKARSELDWFLNILGIDEYYFTSTSVEDIAGHLVAISASGLISRYGGEDMGIQLINEHEERAVYIVEEKSATTEEIEKRIEHHYPHFKIESYRTKEKTGKYFLRLYIVTRPQFSRLPDKPEQLSFEEAADKIFLARSADETIARYRQAWEAMNDRESPYIAVTEKPENNETRVQVGIHSGRTHDFLFNFSHLFYKYKIHSNRKYREIFADKKKIYTFYFDKIDPGTIEEFSRDLVGVVMLPDHYITSIFQEEIFSPHQTIYAISAASFTHQYLTALTREYSTLSSALRDQPEALGILNTLKLRMTKDTYSEERIAATVKNHHETVTLLYNHFEQKFHPAYNRQDLAVLEKEINKYIDIPVFAENDVNVISFGEYIIRGKDELKNIVTIAIGTGIGAGIIINEKIYSGENGTAGEIAHTIINSDGEICECGRRGCLSFCGGEPFKKSFLEELKCIGINEYYGHLISDLTVKDIFDAAKDAEKIAVKYINIFSEYLAKGIININSFFNPDLIVIAGGISLSGSFLLGKIKKKCSEIGALDNWMPKPNVELSLLGNQAGIFGAAMMTKYYLDANQ